MKICPGRRSVGRSVSRVYIEIVYIRYLVGMVLFELHLSACLPVWLAGCWGSIGSGAIRLDRGILLWTFLFYIPTCLPTYLPICFTYLILGLV
ncbi:hypothetical protein B0T22DRAFT_468390 [Podospora appendiculata]|uniref:Uncharacterized protein n=1 Tax=Podospora appendiculata TaxID=314037 RepID=A0AAE0X363_9PEZI|nr:hypothetical protein B0T22DRAFT_468390 [Podospora appendiculata]